MSSILTSRDATAPDPPGHRPGTAPWARAGAAPAGRASRHPAGAARTHPTPASRRLPRGGDLQRAALGFALLWFEVERGRRPLRQLRPLVGAELLDRLEQLPRGDGAPARVLRTTGMRVAADVYEAVVVVQTAGRSSALCLTLRRRSRCGPWRVTDLGRPGAPELPPARCHPPEDPGEDCTLRCCAQELTPAADDHDWC